MKMTEKKCQIRNVSFGRKKKTGLFWLKILRILSSIFYVDKLKIVFSVLYRQQTS